MAIHPGVQGHSSLLPAMCAAASHPVAAPLYVCHQCTTTPAAESQFGCFEHAPARPFLPSCLPPGIFRLSFFISMYSCYHVPQSHARFHQLLPLMPCPPLHASGKQAFDPFTPHHDFPPFCCPCTALPPLLPAALLPRLDGAVPQPPPLMPCLAHPGCSLLSNGPSNSLSSTHNASTSRLVATL